MTMGKAPGKAATLAMKQGVAIREIDMAELQRLLKFNQ